MALDNDAILGLAAAIDNLARSLEKSTEAALPQVGKISDGEVLPDSSISVETEKRKKDEKQKADAISAAVQPIRGLPQQAVATAIAATITQPVMTAIKNVTQEIAPVLQREVNAPFEANQATREMARLAAIAGIGLSDEDVQKLYERNIIVAGRDVLGTRQAEQIINPGLATGSEWIKNVIEATMTMGREGFGLGQGATNTVQQIHNNQAIIKLWGTAGE